MGNEESRLCAKYGITIVGEEQDLSDNEATTVPKTARIHDESANFLELRKAPKKRRKKKKTGCRENAPESPLEWRQACFKAIMEGFDLCLGIQDLAGPYVVSVIFEFAEPPDFGSGPKSLTEERWRMAEVKMAQQMLMDRGMTVSKLQVQLALLRSGGLVSMALWDLTKDQRSEPAMTYAPVELGPGHTIMAWKQTSFSESVDPNASDDDEEEKGPPANDGAPATSAQLIDAVMIGASKCLGVEDELHVTVVALILDLVGRHKSHGEAASLAEDHWRLEEVKALQTLLSHQGIKIPKMECQIALASNQWMLEEALTDLLNDRSA